ncbi:MAG: LptF/LptG family permease [Verrucomicrobiota bacterium]
MRLLDRYLLRELLFPLGYCLCGFLIFWVSSDLISEIGSFQKKHLVLREIAEYYLVTTPELLLVVMPVALLLALLYALTTHARYHELTAMRAAGISLWRIAMPYFAVGLFFSLVYLAINELWVPGSTEKAEEILHSHDARQSNPLGANWRSDLRFLNSRDNRAWRIKAYHQKTFQLQGVFIDWSLLDGKRCFISAQYGKFSDGIWQFSNVEQVTYASAQDLAGSRLSTNLIEFSDWQESPGLIKSEIKINNLNSKQALKKPQLSIADILNYLQLHPRLDANTRSLISTQLHGRIAAPWTCFIVVLIALPFGALSGRRNVFVGVASSIFICFSYFILLRLGLALGIGGYLPGWLAAWLPNILFGSAAIWFTLRVR